MRKRLGMVVLMFVFFFAAMPLGAKAGSVADYTTKGELRLVEQHEGYAMAKKPSKKKVKKAKGKKVWKKAKKAKSSKKTVKKAKKGKKARK